MRDAPQERRGEDVSVAQTLVERLGVFVEPAKGALPLVRARAEFARTLRARTSTITRRPGATRSTASPHRRSTRAYASSRRSGSFRSAPDLASGLWEFALRNDRARAASRRADSRARLDDTCGLVLVLLPGGTFHQGVPVDEEG